MNAIAMIADSSRLLSGFHHRCESYKRLFTLFLYG